MKGLIIKDIYSVRFQVIMAVLIMLPPNLMALLIGSDDLAQDYRQVMVIFMYGVLNLVNICLFSSFVLNTVSSDVNSGWSKIVRTFPVSQRTIVGAKLTSSCIIIGLLVLISMAINTTGIITLSAPAEPMLAMPLCMGLLEAAILCPVFPTAMKHGTKISTVLYILAEVLTIGISTAVIATALSSEHSAAVLRAVFYVGTPLIAAGSAVLSLRSAGKLISE